MSITKKAFVYIAILITMIFWSFSFLWYKDVYLFLSPFTTIFFRLMVSSILLVVFSLAIRRLECIKRADIKNVLLLAFFEPFLYFVGESKGLELVTPTTASVIISVIPLLVPVFAYFLLKERVNKKNILGIAISFLGVLLVIVNKNFEIIASIKGISLLSLSVVAAIFYTILLKRLTEKYNVFTIITWQNTIGVFYFLPLVLIYDFKSWHPSMFTVSAFIPVLKLAVFASSISFLLYAYALKTIGAVKTNVFTNLIPVITAFLSFWLLNEKLIFQNILGIILVIGGLILAQLPSLGALKEKMVINRNR